jgi:hypothetical protein
MVSPVLTYGERHTGPRGTPINVKCGAGRCVLNRDGELFCRPYSIEIAAPSIVHSERTCGLPAAPGPICVVF